MRIFFLVVTACLLASCGSEQNDKSQAAAPARVVAVKTATVPRSLNAVGNVRSSASVSVVPRVTGEILAVNFTEGQDVEEGQLLIRIDPRPYEAALREKRAALARSEAQLRKALNDRNRYARLAENGYVSREAYEQTATEAATLQAAVQENRAAADRAALDLEYCLVKAPAAGRIGDIKIDKGNMVKSGDSSPVAQIDTINPIYVTFSVPEANLPAIMATMRAGKAQVTATPAGGTPETGTLTLVDNAVDTKTGTIRLRGVFANKDRGLWPGQFVEVSLPLGSVENAILAPRRAVLAGREGSYVYAVDEKGAAKIVRVNPLFESGNDTVLEGDLKPGELVVVEGQIRLAPGMPLKILN